MRYKKPLNEGFLSLPFDDEAEADAHDGRPPITFFSHSSEIE